MKSVRVTLRQVSPAGPHLVLDLIDTPTLSGGVGGWQTLDRPRDSSAVYWQGIPARTYELPLQLTGWKIGAAAAVSVEPAIKQLTSWGRPRKSSSGPLPPPVLQVTGPLEVASGSRWVINDLQWGDAERDGHNRRIQAAVTVTLLEYIAPAILKSHAARAKKAKKK